MNTHADPSQEILRKSVGLIEIGRKAIGQIAIDAELQPVPNEIASHVIDLSAERSIRRPDFDQFAGQEATTQAVVIQLPIR